jgi:hypothetical protein
MSNLRKHLDAAKREYEALRYPGDLASELLARGARPARGRFWNAAALLATAALLAVVVRVQVIPHNDQPQSSGESFAMLTGGTDADESADTTEEYVEASLGDVPVADILAPATAVDLAPVAPSFSFSLPSISFAGDQDSQNQQPDDQQQSQQEQKQQSRSVQSTKETVS